MTNAEINLSTPKEIFNAVVEEMRIASHALSISIEYKTHGDAYATSNSYDLEGFILLGRRVGKLAALLNKLNNDTEDMTAEQVVSELRKATDKKFVIVYSNSLRASTAI